MPALKLADILHLLVTIDNLKQNYEKKSTEKSTDKQTNKQTNKQNNFLAELRKVQTILEIYFN